MNQSNNLNDSGPLPIADHNSELETASRRALENILPISRFRFRDERTKDAGVDGSIELLINERSTNFRAQVQLKGTERTDFNQDGNFSLSIKTSNLNYLLNGPSALYILYILPREEIRFVWAHDEQSRLERTNPTWKQQETVTLLFREILNSQALNEVFQRVMREGKMYRQSLETIERTSSNERVVISYDPINLSLINSNEAKELLLKSGKTLVASGKSNEVLDISRIISRIELKNPQIQVVLAYAYFHMGRFETTLVHLSEATLRFHELDNSNKDFLVYLREACNFQTGRIDLNTYIERQKYWEKNQNSELSLSHRLECIRRLLLSNLIEDEQIIDGYLRDLKEIAEEVLANPTAHTAFKLQVRIALLHHEGLKDIFSLKTALNIFKMRIKIGYEADTTFLEDFLNTNIRQWEEKSETLREETWQFGNPLLMGDVLTMHVTIRVFRDIVFYIYLDKDEEKTQKEDEHLIDTIKMAEKAIEIYQVIENIDSELRVKILLADLLELKGDTKKAIDIASEVFPQAEIMGYIGTALRAQQHLSNQTIIARSVARKQYNQNTDNDFIQSNVSDEEIRQVSRKLMQVMKLPDDRYPVLERETFSLRKISLERLNWCRHIDLLQDLRHTYHPDSHFRIDPERVCHCQKYNIRNFQGNQDPDVVIESFKKIYCSICPSREPKNTES